MSALIISNTSQTFIDEFRQTAERLAAHFNALGVPVKPYHEPSLPAFSQLSDEKKEKTLFYIQMFWAITQQIGQADAQNNSRSLWAAMKGAHLRHGSSFFQHLEDDDKIEIYNLEGVQIWRNFNVLQVCSYTLEEVHCYDWIDRYERHEIPTQAILNTIEKVIQSKGTEPLRSNISLHYVRERFSERKLLLNVSHDYFVPLLNDADQVAAFLVTSKVEVLKELSEPFMAQPKATKLSLVPNEARL
jgi:hypothetical protein